MCRYGGLVGECLLAAGEWLAMDTLASKTDDGAEAPTRDLEVQRCMSSIRATTPKRSEPHKR